MLGFRLILPGAIAAMFAAGIATSYTIDDPQEPPSASVQQSPAVLVQPRPLDPPASDSGSGKFALGYIPQGFLVIEETDIDLDKSNSDNSPRAPEDVLRAHVIQLSPKERSDQAPSTPRLQIAIASDPKVAVHIPPVQSRIEGMRIERIHGRDAVIFPYGDRATILKWTERDRLAIQITASNVEDHEILAVARGLIEQP